MKRTFSVALLLLPLVALAQSNVIQDSTEFAKVLNFSPIPGPPVARQVCNQVTTQGPANNTGGAIAGGLVGALVGSRFGQGNGKGAATIAGAIGGAVVGDQIGTGPKTQQQCTTVYDQGPPSGFQVTYDFHGRQLTTTTRNPPGDFLKIHSRITVE